jgi:biotin carboxyl carrier protein
MIPLPPFRLITAPSDARVTSVARAGSIVSPGDVVAVLDAPRGAVPVLAPVHGRIGGSLTGADQSVSIGDGIVWIER